MGKFSGMGAAKVFSQGSYFDGVGEYDCLIKNVMDKDSRNSGACVIVEMEVVASSNPEKVPVGSKKSWVQTLAKKDIAFPNLLMFLAASLGYDSNKGEHAQFINEQLAPKSEALLEEACDEKGSRPLNGKRIHVSCAPHITKDKRSITRVRFSPIG